MYIGLLECSGRILGSTSLKDKRRVIESIKSRVRNTFNLSVAEVDYQDDRSLTSLAFVGVCSSKKVIEQELERMKGKLEETDGFEMIDTRFTFV